MWNTKFLVNWTFPTEYEKERNLTFSGPKSYLKVIYCISLRKSDIKRHLNLQMHQYLSTFMEAIGRRWIAAFPPTVLLHSTKLDMLLQLLDMNWLQKV